MSAVWPTVALGKVIDYRKEFIIIDDLETYRRPRVQLHAQGIVLRDAVPGAEIKTKKQQVARAGEFLVAEIDAKVGGFGIVPDELDGSIVSSHYFLYGHKPDRLDNRYLGWFVKTRAFRQQVEAQGSTNYAAIRPSDVLGYEIPLPPLDEQRRIVARIEELAAKVAEARVLRQQGSMELDSLRSSAAARLFRKVMAGSTRPLGACVKLERGKFSHRPRNDPRFFGGEHPWIQIGEIEASGKYITQWRETLNDEGLQISKNFSRGTVLISIAATIGAVGILDFDCCVPDSIVGVTPPTKIGSEFVYHYLLFLRTHLEAIAPQSAQNNINLQILGDLPFPVLDAERQQEVVSALDTLQAELDAVKALQTETAAELDAMLPAILDKAFKGEL
jgi:type I restriction enzyme S subunit